jgi:hypothetical protein
MSCESYTEWYDRCHPKVVFHYFDFDGVIQTVIKNNNSSFFDISKKEKIELGTKIDPAAESNIKYKNMKPFEYKNEDKEITHRFFAVDVEEARDLMVILKTGKNK